MSVHRSVVLRNFLKEVDEVCNIREYFDSCFYHGCNFLKIERTVDCLLDIRKRHLIELLVVHCLHVLAVHPAEFCHIENGRRFADVVVIEDFYQLLERIDLAVSFRAPSKKGYEVDNGIF